MKRSVAGRVVRWVIVLALLAGAAVAGVKYVPKWLVPVVTVTDVVEGPVVEAFYATGTLLPEREFPIKSNNPGYLQEVFVDKGDEVKKGQDLARVVEDSVEFKFNQAKAELEQARKLAADDSPILQEFDARQETARSLVEIARREQQRISAALEARAASPQDLDRALDRLKTIASEIDTLKAQRAARKIELEKNLQVAEAALRIAQWNLDRQTVRSPIDFGRVLERPLSVGSRLAVNDAIMVLADVRPDVLVMRAQVDEEDKTKVHEGQTVQMTLYAFEARTFEGRVKKVYDKADPQRRTFEVDVEMLDKDPGFAAGMTAELAFIIESKEKARVIPRQAMQGGDVYVVRGGKIEKADAKVGLRSVERAEVLEGLEGGTKVVISPIGNIEPGTKVRTEWMDPGAAAGLNKPKKQELFKGGF